VITKSNEGGATRSLKGKTMKIYWPESQGKKCSFVGYNHAIGLLAKALNGCITSNPDEADFRIYYNIPWHHNPEELKLPGKPLIVCTMFECTKIPSTWVKFLNKHADAILVPSQFNLDVFKMSGVKKPIKVVSLCVDQEEFSYLPIKEHEGFNFLWQGHNYDPNGRKGAALVEKAFRELREEGVFGEDVKLYLKYRPYEDFKVEIDRLEVEPGIIHISSTLSEDEMRELYSTIDCCINTSRGEGFGFIPLEQMAMGRPVIITDWSYPYLDLPGCFRVKYELKKSPVIWLYKHMAFTKQHIEWNLGKGLKEIRLPNYTKRVSNGDLEFGVKGWSRSKKSVWKSIRNLLADLHEKSGFYWKPGKHKRFTLMLEKKGYDAEVDIDDLKNYMVFMYRDKEALNKKSKEISDAAISKWGMHKMKIEFLLAIEELKRINIIRGGCDVRI